MALARRTLMATGVAVSACIIAAASARDPRAPAPQIEIIPDACIPPAFGDPPITRPIDRATTGCGLPGQASAEEADDAAKQEAQNRAKNNFCAWQNTDPALVTRVSFDRLQGALPAPFPSRPNLPTTAQREQLRGLHTTTEGDSIGEGSFVVYVGFLLEGHFAGGESVNCGRTKRQDVDIHLAFVSVKPSTLNLVNRGPTECTSITAEISPHHRPIDWDILGRMTKTPAAQKLTGAQERLEQENLNRPLRITGQLMFDASHALCANGQPTTGNPPRRSGWEIHPAYSVEVCEFTTLQTCRFDRQDVWTTLSDWLSGEG